MPMTLDDAIAAISKLAEDQETVMLKITMPPDVAAKAKRLGHDPVFLARVQKLKGHPWHNDDFWAQYLAMSDAELKCLWDAIVPHDQCHDSR